jgi:hypothetical protein
MERPLGLTTVHWHHEPRTSKTAPPRWHLAGSAFLGLICRQDAGSTLGVHGAEKFCGEGTWT